MTPEEVAELRGESASLTRRLAELKRLRCPGALFDPAGQARLGRLAAMAESAADEIGRLQKRLHDLTHAHPSRN